MILNLSARDRHTKVPGQPSPAGHHSHLAMAVAFTTQILETKKTWEYVSLRAYP